MELKISCHNALLLVIFLQMLHYSVCRPSYVQCQDSAECGVDECCVVGPNRYSVPTCWQFHKINTSCRPTGHISYNTTLHYPDSDPVEVTNVYYIFCPCEQGLICDRKTSTCQNPVNDIEPNSLGN